MAKANEKRANGKEKGGRGAGSTTMVWRGGRGKVCVCVCGGGSREMVPQEVASERAWAVSRIKMHKSGEGNKRQTQGVSYDQRMQWIASVCQRNECGKRRNTTRRSVVGTQCR